MDSSMFYKSRKWMIVWICHLQLDGHVGHHPNTCIILVYNVSVDVCNSHSSQPVSCEHHTGFTGAMRASWSPPRKAAKWSCPTLPLYLLESSEMKTPLVLNMFGSQVCYAIILQILWCFFMIPSWIHNGENAKSSRIYKTENFSNLFLTR